MKTGKKVGIFILLVIFLLALVAIISGFTGVSKGKEAAVGDKDLVLTGNVEAKEMDVSSKVPGRIMKLYVDEGEEVEKGDLLFEIDPKDLQVKKMQAEAAVRAAEAQLNKALSGARQQEINSAKVLLEKAQEKLNLLEKKYERYLPLYEAGALPKDQLDDLETELNVARLDVEAAREQYDLALEGARVEDIEAAQAQYDLYLGQLEEVLINLEETKVTAPIGGSISLVVCEEGELVASGMPVVSIIDYNDAWVEVNVDEVDMGKVALGQKAEIRSKAYPEEVFQGEVVSINKNPDFAVKKSTNELNDQDVITYAVKIKLLDNEKKLYPGMQVKVLLSGNEGE